MAEDTQGTLDLAVRAIVAAAPESTVAVTDVALGDAGVRAVVAALRTSRAGELQVVRCGVTAAQAAVLVRGCRTTEWPMALDLSDNGISSGDTDAFNGFLAAVALAQPHLRRVVLSYNPLLDLDLSILKETVAEAAALRQCASGLRPAGVIYEHPPRPDATPDAPAGTRAEPQVIPTLPLNYLAVARSGSVPHAPAAYPAVPPASNGSGAAPVRMPRSPPPPPHPTHRLLNVRIKQSGVHKRTYRSSSDTVVPITSDVPFEIIVENKFATEAFVCKVALASMPFKCLYKLMPKSHHRITTFGKTGNPLVIPAPLHGLAAPAPGAMRDPRAESVRPVSVMFYAAFISGDRWEYNLRDVADVVSFNLAVDLDQRAV